METHRPPELAFTNLNKLPALRLVWRCIYTPIGAVLGLALGLALTWLALRLPAWSGSAILATLLPTALMAGAGWLYAGRSFLLYQAQLRADEGVVLHSGVWWRSEVWVPIARLQHIDVSQGPLDRKWGMATLTLHTAGTHDHATSIDGLPVDQAHALRAALLPTVRNEHD